jgi:hypothetical protein
MRTAALLLLVGLLGVAACYLRWGSVLAPNGLMGPPRPPPSDAFASVPPDVGAQLARPVPEFVFEDKPLSDVIDAARDRSGANIFVNWKALEASGVPRNARVTVRVRDVEFSKVLRAVLVGISPAPVRPLGLSVDDHVIVISTKEDLDRDTTTAVYDVRNLLPSPVTSSPSTRTAAVDRLLARLTGSVAPQSWRESGGSTGSIRELQGQLIVTQTEANHAQVLWQIDRMRWWRRLTWLAGRTGAVVVPLLAVVALARGWQLQRRRRFAGLVAAGRCVRCGYDLRATPERCPECGMTRAGAYSAPEVFAANSAAIA